MGVWGDDGTVWLPREHYPARSDARRFMVETCEAIWIEVRVLSRWMHLSGYEYPYQPLYSECAKDDPGAFAVWRCE